MMNRPDWDILARYIAGEATEAEEGRVLAWLARDQKNRQLLDTAQVAWSAAGWPEAEWNVESALRRVKSEAQGRLRPGASGRLSGMRPAPQRRFPLARTLGGLAFAAALGAVGLFGAAHLVRSPFGPDGVAVQEMVTEKGQRAQIRLADGSQVTLGPGSHLITLKDYGRSAREVRLTGEAYFDVVADPARPFRVYLGSAVTQVLGTRFGIRAYPDDPSVRVVVAEGSVSLRSSSSQSRAAVLEAGHVGEVTRGAAEVTTRPVDPDLHLAWREGRLVFEGATLEEVVREIERWFGVPVSLGDDSLRTLRLTASFRDQPIEVVLQIIAASVDLEWKRIGETYLFLPKARSLMAAPDSIHLPTPGNLS